MHGAGGRGSRRWRQPHREEDGGDGLDGVGDGLGLGGHHIKGLVLACRREPGLVSDGDTAGSLYSSLRLSDEVSEVGEHSWTTSHAAWQHGSGECTIDWVCHEDKASEAGSPASHKQGTLDWVSARM